MAPQLRSRLLKVPDLPDNEGRDPTLLVSGNKELWSKRKGKHTFSLNHAAQHGRQHHPDLFGVSWPVR